MQQLVTKSNFLVTSAETDMYARMRAGSILNLLIQSAIASADQLGFGFKDLEKHKLFWVLSRITIKIKKILQWNDTIEVETWPKDIDKYLYMRDFTIRNDKGDIAVNATSGWLAINIENKRPSIIKGIQAKMFDELKHKHALETPPEKIDEVSQGKVSEIKISYFDIDLNKHVTATRYIDWMMDSFGPDFHKLNYPDTLSINYMKETMPKEKIILRKNMINNLTYTFEGVNTDKGKTSFRGKINFTRSPFESHGRS